MFDSYKSVIPDGASISEFMLRRTMVVG